jgi:hypothetical protein
MTRVQHQQSDRNLEPEPTGRANDAESLAHLLDQGEIAELFDHAARVRFGVFISAAVLKPTKRRRAR